MNVDALTTRLIELLLESEENASILSFLALGVDELLETPGRELMDAEWLAEHLLTALRSEGPKLSTGRHLEPALQAERERVAKSCEKLGVAIPKEVITGIEARLGRSIPMPAGFGKDIVDSAFIRQIIAASLTETLEAFLSKLPFGVGGKNGDGGLFGTIARKGASRLKNASSALSAMGSGMQNGLKGQAKEFAQQAAEKLKEGVVDRFNSSENKSALQQMRRRAIDAFLELHFSEIYCLADDPGIQGLREWGDLILRHNLERPEIEKALREQVQCVWRRDQDRTIKQWLEEHEIYDPIRAQLLELAMERTERFVKSDSFHTWLSALLKKATD